LLLVAIVLLTVLTVRQVMVDSWLQYDDFVEYWAAGRLNLRGGNPYDPQQMEALQAQTGRTHGIPVMMWNPPWMLALVMPFGAMEYVFGRVVWLYSNLVLLAVCVESLWHLYGGVARYRWVAWLLGLGFTPILQTFKTGQSGVLLLAGLVGFLYFNRRRRDGLAGACLLLATFKPHILYLLFIVLLLWAWKYSRWRAVYGLVLALGGALAIVWLVNPSFLQQYMYAVAHFPPVDWATPTLGGALRLLLGTEHFWLQFVGPVVGLVWLWLYWRRCGHIWNWLEHAPMLVMVSMITAAYGWTYDYPVAIVAFIAVFVGCLRGRWTPMNTVVVSLLIGVNLLAAWLRVEQLWLWWFGPVLLAWYIGARRLVSSTRNVVSA